MEKGKKLKINALAKLFYQMTGCHVKDGYDFSKAGHPAEKGCWNQAVIAWAFIKGETDVMKYQR